jgi:hypothetical protein
VSDDPPPEAPLGSGITPPSTTALADTLFAATGDPPDAPAILGDEATLFAASDVRDEALTLPRRTGPREGEGHPAKIGRYLVQGRLGEGGMGVVYAAFDPQLDRRVAVKLVRPAYGASSSGDDAKARLLREAQALARLRHPNIVQVYEAGAFGEQIYVAMELVDGVTLRKWQFEHAPGWREILRVYRLAGEGLAAAHRAGLTHRDFKPDNVLVTPSGEPRVLDFGLAYRHGHPSAATARDRPAPILDTHVTMTGAVIGTPAYMSPEQHRGEPADARSDIFAFCVALYEAIYGVRPFAGANLVEICANVFTGTITEPSTFVTAPQWLRRAVLRGLRVDPDARYRDMGELLSALGRDPRRLLGWLIAAAVALVILAAFVQALDSAAGERRRQDLSARRRADFDADRIADLEARLGRAEPRSAAAAREALTLADAADAAQDAPERALSLLSQLPYPNDLARARLLARDAAQRRLTLLRRLDLTSAPKALSFAPYHKVMLLSDERGHVLALDADGRQLARAELPAPARALALAQPAPSSDPTAPLSGLRVALALESGALALWEPAAGPPLVDEAGLVELRARAVAISRDGQRLAVGGEDGAILVRRWDGARLHTFSSHRAPVLALAFAADGDSLASASRDGEVIVWRLSQNTRRELGPLGATPHALTLHDDALYVTTSAGSVRRWLLADLRPTWLDHLQGAIDLHFAGAPRITAARTADGRGWIERGPRYRRRSLPVGAPISALDLDPSGERLLIARRSGPVELYSTAAPYSQIHPLGPGRASALTWSPDGATLAAAASDGRVVLLDPERGERRILSGAEPPLRSLSFSPGGDALIAEVNRGALAYWRLDAASEPASIIATTAPANTRSRPLWWTDDHLLRVACVAACRLDAIDLRAVVGATHAPLAELSGGEIGLSDDGGWIVVLGEGAVPSLLERRGDHTLHRRPVALDDLGDADAVAYAFVDGGLRLAITRRSARDRGALVVWHIDLDRGHPSLIFETDLVSDIKTDLTRQVLHWRDRGGDHCLWDLAGPPPRRLPRLLERVNGLAIARPAGRALLWGAPLGEGQREQAILIDLSGGAAIELEPRAELWALAPTGQIAGAAAELGLVVLTEPAPRHPEALRTWLLEQVSQDPAALTPSAAPPPPPSPAPPTSAR